MQNLWRFFTDPIFGRNDRRERPWILLTFSFTAIIAVKSLWEAYAAPYTVQDDARQFIFWMAKWRDPDLFKNDMVAAYFESVSPHGFTAIYWIADRLGFDPITASKLFPPILMFLLAWLAFRFSMRIFPSPQAAFVAASVTALFMSLNDIVFSATPRAFAVPFFLAFLIFLLRQSFWGVVLMIGLMASFYPQVALVAVGTLCLSILNWQSENGKPRFTLDLSRRRITLVLGGTAMGLGLLSLFALDSSAFGPSVTLAQARQWPAFGPGGRSEIFLSDGSVPILCDGRTGFLPREWGCVLAPTVLSLIHVVLVYAIPFWLVWLAHRSRALPRPRPEAAILVTVLAAISVLYALAYLVMFELHLPGRYSTIALRATGPLAFGLSLFLCWAYTVRWAGPKIDREQLTGRQKAVLVLALGFLACLIVATIPPKIAPRTLYQAGPNPQLYEFLRQQPTTILIASLAPEADYVPIFGQRSVLIAQEYAIPYSSGYFLKVRERTESTIRLYFTPSAEEFRSIVQKWGINFILVEEDSTSVAALRAGWWNLEYPQVSQEMQSILTSETPDSFLSKKLISCSILKEKLINLVDANCAIRE